MSNGVPECNPACQKILLNSGNIRSLNDNFAAFFLENKSKVPDAVKEKIIKSLNTAEDELRKAQTLALRAIGYDGAVGGLNS